MSLPLIGLAICVLSTISLGGYYEYSHSATTTTTTTKAPTTTEATTTATTNTPLPMTTAVSGTAMPAIPLPTVMQESLCIGTQGNSWCFYANPNGRLDLSRNGASVDTPNSGLFHFDGTGNIWLNRSLDGNSTAGWMADAMYQVRSGTYAENAVFPEKMCVGPTGNQWCLTANKNGQLDMGHNGTVADAPNAGLLHFTSNGNISSNYAPDKVHPLGSLGDDIYQVQQGNFAGNAVFGGGQVCVGPTGNQWCLNSNSGNQRLDIMRNGQGGDGPNAPVVHIDASGNLWLNRAIDNKNPIGWVADDLYQMQQGNFTGPVCVGAGSGNTWCMRPNSNGLWMDVARNGQASDGANAPLYHFTQDGNFWLNRATMPGGNGNWVADTIGGNAGAAAAAQNTANAAVPLGKLVYPNPQGSGNVIIQQRY